MFIYIWKSQEGIPFYVGLTKNRHRTNPCNNGSRNWLTLKKLEEIGAHSVVVELIHVDSIVAGQELERKLIAQYGRIDKRTGTLTNLRVGGEGVQIPTEEHRAKLRAAMLRPDHPVYSAKSREKQRERMQSPDVQILLRGDNNPAKGDTVRKKLKELWQDPEYREQMRASRTGKKKVLSEETKDRLRQNLKDNPQMRGWGERNGKDPEFERKRIAALRAAQSKRLATMADPEKNEARKKRLKETMNSEEFKAKRAEWDTPEYRAKLSEAKRKYWADKKAEKLA